MCRPGGTAMAAKTVADAAACCAACTAAEGCAAWVHRSDPKTKQVSPTLVSGKRLERG